MPPQFNPAGKFRARKFHDDLVIGPQFRRKGPLVPAFHRAAAAANRAFVVKIHRAMVRQDRAWDVESQFGQVRALFLDTADDPVVQRILTPRVALTVAEYLAFDLEQHVLVILADMTSYCEALREVSAARGEIPGRRAYPGYLYSDLASIYERCGRIRGRRGSLTLVPVLTMPAGDITHPIPDLSGYITEGQIVLSPQSQAADFYPPVDVLASLSRLMRKGTGAGRTRADHPAAAAQLLAALARARSARDLADLIGEAALTETDRRLPFRLRACVQRAGDPPGAGEARSLEDTLSRVWEVSLQRRAVS